MSYSVAAHIEIDGSTPTAGQLAALAFASYGHFTAMQVRNGRVRGLDFHLRRLDDANCELFGSSLDGGRVKDLIRHALGDTRDASVRVMAQRPDPDQLPRITVTVRPPAPAPDAPVSLQSVPYQRALAHIKHLGDFGQAYYAQLAERNGFDEALLTGPDGLICEGAITNIGFFDGAEVVWPAAAALDGVTMLVIRERLALPQLHRPVRLADLGSFASVFVTNSHGIAVVGHINDLVLPVDPDFMKVLTESYDSAPWDPI
jgi:branched-subunit amino acid aminotransferase/4-amino-4-deoxychorismate lyase